MSVLIVCYVLPPCTMPCKPRTYVIRDPSVLLDLKGKSSCMQILSSCVSYRRHNAPSLQQVRADLLKERLIPYQPLFTYTGLDLFKPFYVKAMQSGSTVKVYGGIFVSRLQ